MKFWNSVGHNLITVGFHVAMGSNELMGPTTALTAQAKPNKPKPRPSTQSQWSSPPPNTSWSVSPQQQYTSLSQNPPRQQNHYTVSQAHTMNTGPSKRHYLLDSGATHHVTTDLNNLSVYHPYTGPHSLFVGDGSGLHISHSGTLKLHDISLPNVLCVPSMKQNVLSVSKLTKETNSALIFLPDYFVMKDLQTGHTKLKGPCVNDVYIWPSSSSSVNHL
ncbi:uncharacterized protein LOC106763752 [Vigna radiata var. radiata]|uniref:Uncharacterized protein LOC106763752 n=1 Tax=Vigna radiata var. radiata TaxID=3916 RepID=A0A1S3UBR0_VIGRR|nr:uncharacterized protein LOC106763752 [Vigna radiata var. radiata]